LENKHERQSEHNKRIMSTPVGFLRKEAAKKEVTEKGVASRSIN
jgi:precorrin isomerase